MIADENAVKGSSLFLMVSDDNRLLSAAFNLRGSRHPSFYMYMIDLDLWGTNRYIHVYYHEFL